MSTEHTPGQDKEYVEFARPIQNIVVRRLVSIIDRLEAEKDKLNTRCSDLWDWTKELEAEKAELVNVLKLTDVEVCNCPVAWEEIAPIIKNIRAAVAKAGPEDKQ